MATPWPVIDLNEKWPGATNADIMIYQPEQPLDLIVSISTLEHIGYNKWTDTGLYKLSEVMVRLERMLAPGGVFVATVPIGWRPDMDAEIRTEQTGADQVWYMRQTSEVENTWTECTQDEALAQSRGRWARAMAVLQCGEFPKGEHRQ
jgi:cyclopropane fatty-acyl-phospholipid synthase-like methyltransferase